MTEGELQRFEAKYAVEPNTGCWLWLGTPDANGYARMCAGKKQQLAHRLSHEHFKGPIPARFDVDHLCRQRCCVNPDHLEAVTHAENVRRGVSPCAAFAKVTHCPSGHLYAGENLYVQPNGGRRCRACARINHVVDSAMQRDRRRKNRELRESASTR